MTSTIPIDWHLVKKLHLRASQKIERANLAEAQGQPQAVKKNLDTAMRYIRRAALCVRHTDREPQRSVIFLTAALLAFKAGQFDEAKEFIEDGMREGLPFEQTRKFYELKMAVFHAGLRTEQCA